MEQRGPTTGMWAADRTFKPANSKEAIDCCVYVTVGKFNYKSIVVVDNNNAQYKRRWNRLKIL